MFRTLLTPPESKSTIEPFLRLLWTVAVVGVGGACYRAPEQVIEPAPVNIGGPSEPIRHDSRPAPRSLYVERSYGSDAQFNPFTVIVNEGFDMMRIDRSRAVFDLPYRQSADGVWHSLINPEPAIRHFGWGRWLRTEVLPLSLSGKRSAQWVPNYHLHLFGAGMTYARTADWFEARDVPHPRLAAAATLWAGHFLNEVVENIGNTTRETEDALTDLLIFDPAGMLLWNQEWMRRRFSGSVEINNWYGQPTLMLPTKRLENTFSAYMVRAPLPRTNDWKVITTGGNAFLIGVSRAVGDSLWISVTGGAIPVAVPVIDARTNTKTAELKPNVGIFIDRNGSLLASFLGQAGQTNGPTLNIYPGVLRLGPISPGIWVQAARGGFDRSGVRWGISSHLGLGLGGVGR